MNSMLVRSRLGAKFAAVAATVVAALALTAPPALAHYLDLRHGWDRAWSSNHFHVNVEDNECDNNSVLVRVWLSNGVFKTHYDSNGCVDGFGHLDTYPAITSIQLCEEERSDGFWRTDCGARTLI